MLQRMLPVMEYLQTSKVALFRLLWLLYLVSRLVDVVPVSCYITNRHSLSHTLCYRWCDSIGVLSVLKNHSVTVTITTFFVAMVTLHVSGMVYVFIVNSYIKQQVFYCHTN